VLYVVDPQKPAVGPGFQTGLAPAPFVVHFQRLLAPAARHFETQPDAFARPFVLVAPRRSYRAHCVEEYLWIHQRHPFEPLLPLVGFWLYHLLCEYPPTPVEQPVVQRDFGTVIL